MAYGYHGNLQPGLHIWHGSAFKGQISRCSCKPEAAETAATFTPLAPFSKLIGKGVRQIVDAIAAKRRR